jgi:hypothetical protein
MAISASCSGCAGKTAMAESPWWERTPEGTPLLVAFVQVVRDPVAGESLQQRDRYLAGVEYIADKRGASQPLHWRGNDVLLLLHAEDPHTVITTALSIAEAIRERVLVDLSMSVRLAVHAARVQWTPDRDRLAPLDVGRCEQLARAAPLQGIALTEDAYLTLSELERRRFAPLGTWAEEEGVAYVFPSSLASTADSGRFQPIGDERSWELLRRYVESPEVRRLRYVGFPLQKKQPPSLDIREVFIPPEVRRLVGRGPEWIQTAALPLEPLARLVRGHRALVVLGDPGSGKTTVLRWLAVLAAGGPLTWAEQIGTSERLLPLLVSVGRLAQLRSRLGEGCSVAQALAVYFEDRDVGSAAELQPFLEGVLEAGDALLLLDGLDEVRREEREGVLRWLEAFGDRHPDNRFVVSARRVGFVGFNLPESAEVELGDFQEEQIRSYVRAFERACRRWENEGAPDEVGAERESNRLLDALFTNPRLRDLARSPFLLSSLSLIHRAEGRLPRHRVQAYEIFARTLCETWGQARRVVASENSSWDIRYEEEAIPILGALALRLHLEWPTGVAPEDVVIRILSQAIQERGGGSAPETERAAREFLVRAGRDVQILLERGAGQWGFLHLTFQEFFTAVGLLSAEDFESVAFAHLLEPRWEEVLRLGVGYMALVQKRAQATQRFIRRVLSQEGAAPEPRRAYLAALLASEAGDILPPSLQAEIARVVVAWNQSQPESTTLPLWRELSLTEFSDRLLDELTGTFSSQKGPTEEKTIVALGTLRGERARDALRLAARSPNPAVRVQVARSLVLGGDPMDWETLVQLTDDPQARVRGAALEGFIATREPVQRDEVLGQWLSGSQVDVLHLVIRLLVFISGSRTGHSRPGVPRSTSTGLVGQALRKGLSHGDPRVRDASLSLLALERAHFPDEARAHERALEDIDVAALDPFLLRRILRVDAERELHERVLRGDPLAMSDLFLAYARRIERSVQRELRCDEETAHDAVVDVIFSYLQRPEMYAAGDGLLISYLMTAARDRASAKLVARARAAARGRDFSRVDDLQAWVSTKVENAIDASRVMDRLVRGKYLNDERDVAALHLLLSGEHSLETWARALGLAPSSSEGVRREVNRHRQRLLKILRRFKRDEEAEPS